MNNSQSELAADDGTSLCENLGLLIGGERVSGANESPVIDPATGTIIAYCPRASREQLEFAVAAARSALADWRSTSLADRAAVLRAMADRIEQNCAELAVLLTREQGKPLTEARAEISMAIAVLRYYSDCDLPATILEDSEQRHAELHREPIGVIGAIVPWNFPVSLFIYKAAPALLAGNTVIVKPAATTPLTTLVIGDLVADLVPAGVLNIIADENELGGDISSHPDIDKIAFTGSTQTGRRVMAAAAANLKRLTLELGGNDAAIVLDDVDPEAVAEKIYAAAFSNSGQICIAIKRLYVQDGIYDALCEALAVLAENAVVGNGLQEGVRHGPVQNAAQFQSLTRLLEESREAGTIIAGGGLDGATGYFIRPTIVRDIEDGARLVDEEQFGPILPIVRFTDPEDAVARANASPFGLGASVWSSNPRRAYDLAGRLEAGTVWINKHRELAPGIPFGGIKQSGFGSELGLAGLEEFTRRKVIHIAK